MLKINCFKKNNQRDTVPYRTPPESGDQIGSARGNTKFETLSDWFMTCVIIRFYWSEAGKIITI